MRKLDPRVRMAEEAFKLASTAFTKLRNIFIRKGIPKPGAQIAAMGARGAFQSMTRGAARKELTKQFGIALEQVAHQQTREILSAFADAIADINARALQNYFNSMDFDQQDRWFELNRERLAEAYLQAAQNFARSGIYDFLVKSYLARHGIEGDAAVLVKEYGFAVLDEAVDAARTWAESA